MKRENKIKSTINDLDIRFDCFKSTVDIGNIWVRVFDELFGDVITHQNNNLFLQQALGGHSDSWLDFVVWSIDYFLYLFDFLVGEVQKHLLNL